MRLSRLDLLRYGHFTERSFDLPAEKSDFHIFFGPNEAGKSTALAAIEDLLFGIPMHSPYNFLHDYASMRIGAVLENDHATLEILRRKGNKDTLLGPDGSPIAGGDGALNPYLAGADRSFFERMFSLDHIRLQAGGQEILAAKDDVGQMLFSAGAGIAGLRERLGDLAAEADELWGARRAKHRKFYHAQDKLTGAQKALREQTLTAIKWRDLKRTYDQAEQAYAELDKKIKEIGTERNRLNRVRRVFGDVRRKQELDDELAQLENVIALADDAAKLVTDAESKDTRAATRIATLQDQLAKTKQSLDGLTYDERLVQRAEDIHQLHERRIETRREKADLPKHEAELDAAEQELRGSASELGWPETESAALIERIPSRTQIALVRSLLNQKGELEADVANRTRLLQESRDALDELNKQLDETGDTADVSRLAVIIKAVRRQGDPTGRVQDAEKTHKDAQARVKRRLADLNPAVFDENAVADIPVPVLAEVQQHRDRARDWERRVRDAQQRTASVRQDRDGAVAAFERAVRDERVVTPEDLDQARRRRDALWELVKRQYVQAETVTESRINELEAQPNDLAGAFEPAMAQADDLADRRFDHAEAAGRIAEIKRKIGEQETLLEQAGDKETQLEEEGALLTSRWAAMWATAPFEPLSPEAMMEWIDARKQLLAAIEEREAANNTLETLRNAAHESREQLLGELRALGIDIGGLEDRDLNVVIEHAAEEQRLREAAAAKQAELEATVKKAAKTVAQRQRELGQAKDPLDEWRNKWTAALAGLGLAADTPAEAVAVQIEIIDQMRETAGRIATLRHDRIDRINRDVGDFERVVAELLRDLAEDLVDRPAEQAVVTLEARLDQAARDAGLREVKNEEMQSLTSSISELDAERRELAASISHLKQAAGVETNAALRHAIERSDRKRALARDRQQVIDKLQHDGDGKSLEELDKECEGIVIDEVAARERSIQAELENLQARQTDAADERSRARQAFAAVGGDDAAARAAASKQEALAEMQEIAERYVRVKTSAILLQWAIDRYRREKQAPLLKRAGELFTIMTDGSFSSLQVAFDDQDSAHLTGVRPQGGVVAVPGMSTGTADQLYLALRVAAIEDYLERADALPFVADDLFINFDDQRAAAGFRLLRELSGKTQVLFFTHNQHLVEIAQKTLGASVSVLPLADQRVPSRSEGARSGERL